MADRYLKLLSGSDRQHLFASFDDAKDGAGRRPRPQHRLGTLESVRDWITNRQREGCGIFVCVQKMRGSKRGNSEVESIRAVFAELDHGWPAGGFPLEPSFTPVSSAGRFQPVWLVDPSDPITKQDFEQIMRCMIEKYGSDPNAKDLARVLRLPGTRNLKPDRDEFLVRITEETGCVYGRRELMQHFTLPEKPRSDQRETSGSARPTSLAAELKRHRAWANAGIAADVREMGSLGKGGRHDALYKRACRWGYAVHHGICSEGELIAALLDGAQRNGYEAEEGREKCIRDIRDGIAAAKSDPLPVLEDRARASARPNHAASSTPGTSTAPAWQEVTNSGAPRARSIFNVVAFLEHMQVKFSRNTFTWQDFVTIADDAPRPLSDEVMRQLRMEAERIGFSPPREFFEEVCLDEARQSGYNPPRDWLEQIQPTWDGKPRLDKWLTDYLGADDTPLNRAFGRKHLIAAVRRIRTPGAKHDAILVLEGAQGIGKSSAIRALAGDDWFSDALTIGADAKQVIEDTRGSWLVEMPELSGLRKADVEPVKAMVSRQVDRARLAYERHSVDRPRQFVLFGTVNEKHYLRDSTGNRRFWTVAVRKADVEGLERARVQIWAEAANYEAKGESIGLPESLWKAATEAQAERVAPHRWQEILQDHLEGKNGTITKEGVYKQLLDLDSHKQDGYNGQLVNQIMNQMGWRVTRRRHPVTRNLRHAFTNQPEGEPTTWIDPSAGLGTHSAHYSER